MLYRERIAIYSEIHTEHINTLGGQKQNFCLLKLVVPIRVATTGL